MIADEQVAQIRHLFHAEHWKIGTIAAELHLHPDTVRAALDTDRFRSHPRLRHRLTDPYLDLLRQTLQQYPRLRATRLFQMIRSRGYPGSITQLCQLEAAVSLMLRRGYSQVLVRPCLTGLGDVLVSHPSCVVPSFSLLRLRRLGRRL
jgi:hypothetical protein